jgi:pre-rRNA-processing protein TSR3
MRAPTPVILHLSQDDPRKCTARKLSRFNKARLVDRFEDLPYGSVLLDPFSERALSPEDSMIIGKRGIVAVDCSWEEAESVFDSFRKAKRMEARALPMLLAANPTKFGRWGELSTLEALAAAYFIIGSRETAEDLLSIYTWGIRFLETNMEPLEAYAACRDSAEVVEVQKEFI